MRSVDGGSRLEPGLGGHPDTAALERILPGAVALLSLGAFGCGMSMRMLDPLLPVLAGAFGVTLGGASALVTVCVIACGVAQLLFGPLGDRYGKYRVVAVATLACAATHLLCALAPGLPGLLTLRFLAGTSIGAIVPLGMAWIGDVTAYERRQSVLARFMIGQIMGFCGGALIGGLAADIRYWQLPFVIVAMVFLVAGCGLLWLHHRLPPLASAVRLKKENALRQLCADFRYIGAQPHARVVLLAGFLEGGLMFGPLAFTATHLHHAHGISLALAGMLIMLFGGGGLAFALAAGPLVRYFGEAGLVRVGAGVLAVALVFVALAPVWWFALPGCFCAGLGFYALHSTLQTNATQMAPDCRGASLSAFASCFLGGQAIGVGVSGALVARIGTTPILLCGAAGLVAMGLGLGARLHAGSVAQHAGSG